MADETRTETGEPGQMARPLLAYRCAAGVDTATDLCRAFGALLGQVAPGHALRPLQPEEAAPALRPRDVLVTLQAEKTSAYRLTAQIAWQEGPDAAPQTGPEVSLDSSDAPLGPAMYPDFLRDLWRLGAPASLSAPD